MLTTERPANDSPRASAPRADTRSHPHLKSLIEQARSRGSIAVAVAYPCDASSIEAAQPPPTPV